MWPAGVGGGVKWVGVSRGELAGVVAVAALAGWLAACGDDDGGSDGGDGGTAGADAAAADAGVFDGYPGAGDTGIPAGACAGGLRDATTDDTEPASGTTVECVRFTGALPYIRDSISDVTYRYCRFETGEGDSFINLQGGPVIIEDSELAGSAGTWVRASYEAHGMTLRRNDFSGMANAAEWGVDDVVIEDNFVHDFGDVDQEQHADGFQGGGQNLVLRHNTVLLNAVWGGTGAVMLEGDGLVENNLVAGGGYTIYVKDDLDVVGNHVSTVFSDTSGEYGPVYPESLGAGGSWENNVWHDGPNAGQPIEAP